MNSEALQARDQLAATYLEQLQALAFEINAAMEAVSANALSRLEESVAKQEMLCASLATMANAVGDEFRSSEQSSPSRLDAPLELKIRGTSGAIRNLNLQYAALLKHSGRSIAVLASLCRSHTGQSQEARGPRFKHQTWSCEM
jgi:hypothetical protein